MTTTDEAVAREADFRQQAAIVDAGVSAMGAAYVPQTPAYPNKPLIIGGSLGLGLAFGILIALLTELLDRRVRSPEDLTAALGLPVLAVIRLPS
jgi:capsular polysaccharide biosynthesis protein